VADGSSHTSRLRAAGEALAANAREAIAAPRVTNTPRRVEQARIAVERAERELLIGQLAVAIADNPPPALAKVKTVRDVGELYDRLRIGAYAVAHRHGWGRDRVDEVELREAALFAPWPNRTAYADHIRACGVGINPDVEGRIHLDINEETRAKWEQLLAHAKCPEYVKDIEAANRRLAAMGIRDTLPLVEALRALVDLMPAKGGRDPVKEIERELVGARIPGFFPTPKELARRMVAMAIKCGGLDPEYTWIEPSAGSGHIAEALREAGAYVGCIERNHTLCRLLAAKGFDVLERDFLEYRVSLLDRPVAGFVMNPPFEDGQDIDHVLHAFDQLGHGGIVVAIMSCGPFFRTDGKAKRFQQWLATVDVLHIEDLPPGTFNRRDVTQRTSVAAKLLVIRKEQS
jgi:predicted RNA methylase